MKRHELTDEQWTKVEKHFKRQTGRDPRVRLNGVMWVLGTGAPWRDLPERFGPRQTVYRHFRDWCKRGVFARPSRTCRSRSTKRG